MAIRTPFKSGMENAVQDLKAHYHLYREEFQQFFPEIIDYTIQRRINI
jgi:acyl carrier protein phosphodiesterase